jgi:hypothetical protein
VVKIFYHKDTKGTKKKITPSCFSSCLRDFVVKIFYHQDTKGTKKRKKDQAPLSEKEEAVVLLKHQKNFLHGSLRVFVTSW